MNACWSNVPLRIYQRIELVQYLSGLHIDRNGRNLDYSVVIS